MSTQASHPDQRLGQYEQDGYFIVRNLVSRDAIADIRKVIVDFVDNPGEIANACQNAYDAHFGLDPDRWYDVEVTFVGGRKVVRRNIVPGDLPGHRLVVRAGKREFVDTALFKYETGVGSSFDAGITNVQPIPEPATYLLMSVGFLVLFGIPYLRKWCRGYEFFG